MVHQNFPEQEELKNWDTATEDVVEGTFLYQHRQNLTGSSRELNAPIESEWLKNNEAGQLDTASKDDFFTISSTTATTTTTTATATTTATSPTTATTFPYTSDAVSIPEFEVEYLTSSANGIDLHHRFGDNLQDVTQSSDDASPAFPVTSSQLAHDVTSGMERASNQNEWPRSLPSEDPTSSVLMNSLDPTQSSDERWPTSDHIPTQQVRVETWKNLTLSETRQINVVSPTADYVADVTHLVAQEERRYLNTPELNDSIFGTLNVTSLSSGSHALNTTFQFDANLSADGPLSFNFDLYPLFTLTPHTTPEDYDMAPGAIEEVTSLMIFKVIVLALISLVGSFGNVLVIWSIVKERHLHRPPFYFLLSLGVTDLSRAVFCVPVVITTVLHGSTWRHGESACKLFAFATSFFVFSSALSLLAISIDRHISIVYSKTYRRRSPGIVNLVVAVIIWIIAFSVSFPPVVGVGDYVFIPDEAQCTYHHKHYSNNDSVSSVIVFLAILTLTYFLYFRIFRFLRTHRRMRPLQHTPALSSNWAFVGPGANGQAFINWLNGFGGQAPVRQGGQRTVQRLNFGRVVNLSTAKNEHLTRLFLLLTIVFGLLWFPYIVLSIWRIFFDSTVLPSAYVTVAAWLGYGQVALCPVVYFLIRGPAKRPSRTVYSHAEKREFLLENKIGK